MKKVLLLVGILALGACSDPETAIRVLDENGYTNIQILGPAVFMCGRDDTFSTEFTAVNSNGKTVHGAVCNAFGKGATIRFY